jgi:hypothetical protein
MKRSQFSDEQSIAVMKKNEAGVCVGGLCRRQGVSKAVGFLISEMGLSEPRGSFGARATTY